MSPCYFCRCLVIDELIVPLPGRYNITIPVSVLHSLLSFFLNCGSVIAEVRGEEEEEEPRIQYI